MATWIFFLAAKHLPEPPDPDARINPLVVSLDPSEVGGRRASSPRTA